MFKLVDLEGNEVRFDFPLVLSTDGRLLLLEDDGAVEVKREGKYIIQMLEYGRYIPY